MDTLRRLRFVTERYPHLQGLRLVPLGFPFLISGAWRSGSLAGIPEITGIAPRYLFLLLLIAAMAVSALAGRYYRRQFGTVQPHPRLGGALALVGFAAALALSVWLQDAFQPAIPLPMVVIGLSVGLLGLAGGHVRWHYLALAALCLMFASSGVLGVPIDTRDALLDNLIGLGLIVIGLGDHLLLRRTLEPVSRVEAV